MKCEACGKESPAGAKFCGECGAPLRLRCPSCATENLPKAKFCTECGDSMAAVTGAWPVMKIEPPAAATPPVAQAPVPAEAERRQLTVMFCDLANSTQLSQFLDPEDLRELICAYQESCAQVVERFGGTIAQYLGDGILVYFGYPSAHEDDALRAVRAAIGILDAMGSLRADARAKAPEELAVRIGIHTGRVVVGDVGGGARREQLALGDTPNIAARLQGLAERNAITISPTTHQLTRGFFETRSLGTHTLKGVAEPMEVRTVLKESGIRHRLESTESGRTPWVGREAELGAMLEAWAAARAGRGQALLVTGEGGIGKSRLVRVLEEEAESTSSTLLQAFCSPYFGNTALHPILELVRSSAGFAREDASRERLQKLRGYLGGMRADRGDTVPLLASLLSIPPDAGYLPPNLSPQAQRQKTLEALAQVLLHSSTSKPALVVVEDLHWMDPSTLDLLGLVIQQLPSRPVLLLLTARPSFESPWAGVDHVRTIPLSNLPTGQTEDLIRGVTGGRDLPPAVVSLLVEKTDGIPLYIEEMTRMVLEAGMLKAVGDRYELADALPKLTIPATLHDSLMARLDRMEPSAKKVAQVGACIGREFSLGLSSAVLPGQDEALRGGLDRLVEAQLVFAPGNLGSAHYSFKHALIQDAAYESLLRRTRQEYHERIAQALERELPDLIERQPERLAQHYTKAARPEKAIPYWLVAGRQAVATSANPEAVGHLKEGLRLVESLPEGVERARLELDLLSTLGTALSALQGYASPEVEKTYARAHELCGTIGRTPQQFWVLWGLWAFHLVRGEHHEAVAFGEKMMELGRAEDDLSWELEAHFSLGLSFFFMGRLRPAREHLERAVAIYDPEKHHANAFQTIQDVGVTSRSVAALCLWHLGETELALERSRQALELAGTLAHPFSKAYALGCAAWFNLYLRDTKTALARAREAVDLSIEQGFLWWQVWGTILGGRALADTGTPAVSVTQIKGGIDGWRMTGSGFTIPYFLALQAEACRKDGRTDEALALVAEALGLIGKTDEGFYAGELHRLEGELRREKSGGADEAGIEACFQRALEAARGEGARGFELRAATSLARLWSEQGKGGEARRLLAEACASFDGGPVTLDVAEARALLETLPAA